VITRGIEMVEVLLTQTVEKLGEPGDVVDVAPGYARNYLFPKGLAVEPTPHNIQRLKKVREERLAELGEREERAKLLKEKLDGFVLTFHRKVHDDKKLYSSVRPEEIATRISEEFQTEIEKGRVQLPSPIETLGRHPVVINLYKDIAAEVEVEVLEESEEPPSGE
jgi:large subunit ribosomal protein L9